MLLTDNEKEYLLGVLESHLADCEGLGEWEDYRTCETLIAKISKSQKGNDRQNEK